jgi:hypothetical protein
MTALDKERSHCSTDVSGTAGNQYLHKKVIPFQGTLEYSESITQMKGSQTGLRAGQNSPPMAAAERFLADVGLFQPSF